MTTTLRVDLSYTELLIGMMLFYTGPRFTDEMLRQFLKTSGNEFSLPRLTPRRTETGDKVDALDSALFHLEGSLLVASPFGERDGYDVLDVNRETHRRFLEQSDKLPRYENLFRDLAYRFARRLRDAQ